MGLYVSARSQLFCIVECQNAVYERCCKITSALPSVNYDFRYIGESLGSVFAFLNMYESDRCSHYSCRSANLFSY